MPDLLQVQKQWTMEYVKQLTTEFSCWTDIMGKLFERLHVAGATPTVVTEAISQVPMSDGIAMMLQSLHSARVPAYIVSDSNTVFIESILKARQLTDVFPSKNIFTNPVCLRWRILTVLASVRHQAHFDDSGRLCIAYHHSHDCSRCSRNLCKGLLVDQLLAEHVSPGPKLTAFARLSGRSEKCNGCVCGRRTQRLLCGASFATR